MRKIVFTAWVTLDGRISGADGGYDFVLNDDEMSNYEVDIMANSDTLIFGRYTYLDFGGHWPDVEASADAPERLKAHAHRINTATKVVFSHALEQNPPWGPVRVFRSIDAAKIKALKAEPGKDILIWGSASIIQQLTNLGLIDEYQLLTHPSVLGGGKRIWDNIEKHVRLSLVETRPFASGVILAIYRPARA